MPSLSVSTYEKRTQTSFGPADIALAPAVGSEVVAVGGASTQSNALPASASIVRLVSDVACYVAMGEDPTADANSPYLPAGVVEYFGLTPGVNKVAVLVV